MLDSLASLSSESLDLVAVTIDSILMLRAFNLHRIDECGDFCAACAVELAS